MSKKVTIQDVADAAGVCKATVSYVLNDRQDQKISEETKKKVWQVVNMLNYRPNAFAQNMRTSSERRLIAVYPPRGLSVPEKAALFDFLTELLALSRTDGFSVVLLDGSPDRVAAADAVIACGITREEFSALGECNFIPIVSVDCPIGDALFFEIATDYAALKREADAFFKADYTYACIPPRSEELAAAIREVFPRVCFIRSFADGELPAGRVLVTQPTLAEIFAGRQGVELYFAQNALPAKAEVTAECVRLALSHDPCEQHVFKA